MMVGMQTIALLALIAGLIALYVYMLVKVIQHRPVPNRHAPKSFGYRGDDPAYWTPQD